jgi:hypothetical protein
LTVNWTAASSRSVTDWIGLYKVGDPNTNFIEWKYTAGTATGSMTFTAPSFSGQYEFRYFSNNSFVKLATSNVIIVSQAFSLNATPSQSTIGQNLVINWIAPSGRPANDWIGLYRVRDPETSFISWKYTSGTTAGSASFTAPNQPGQYEFRYFTNDSYVKVATSNPVSVSAANSYSVFASPSALTGGGGITVNWTAPLIHSAVDWVGLYQVGSTDTQFVWWEYTGGTSFGVMNATAPQISGQYEFRYFRDNGFIRVAVSNHITVSSTYSVSASPGTVLVGGLITVSWMAPPGHSGLDWVGIYRTSGVNTQFVSWEYTGPSSSGTMVFTAPQNPDNYEFRYFLNDGFNRVTVSNPVTVMP